MLPYFFYTHRIVDAVEVLEELEYITDETDDIIGKAWYFACCMDFILESGKHRKAFVLTTKELLITAIFKLTFP